MKINGKQFFSNNKPNGYFDSSSVGRLAIFLISFKHLGDLLNSFDSNLEQCDPNEFVKKLLPYICYPEKDLGEDNNKPDKLVLSEDEISKMSKDELEKIAKLHLEYESYLSREQVEKTTTNKKGEKVVSFEDGEIKHPKKDGESDVQYLHRLYVIYEKKQKEQMAAKVKSLMGPAHFSMQALKSISSTLSMGESMKKTLEGLRIPKIDTSAFNAIAGLKQSGIGDSLSQANKVLEGLDKAKKTSSALGETEGIESNSTSYEPVEPKIDFEEIHKERWEPFKFLGEKIDKLTGISSDSAKFMIETNETQTLIASGIKTSGESASRWAKIGILFTAVVIALTGFAIWLSYNQSKSNSNDAKQRTKQVIQGLENINQSVLANNASAKSDLLLVLTEMKKSRESHTTKFNKLLAEQAAVIKQLSDQRIADQRIIKELKHNFADFKIENSNNLKNNPVTEDK